jgi:GGDEF domain-containing protein
MPEITGEIMVTVPNDILIAQTTVVTSCLALMIWLGLLGRPSRATLLWSLGFALALLGSYGSVISASGGTDVLLHPVAFGIICGAPTLLWSGLRAAKGERSYAWVGFVQSAASFAALWLTTDAPIGFTVFRMVFFVASLGAALGAVEVLRGSFHGSRFGTPLVVSSAALVLLAIIGLVGSVTGASDASSIMFVRGVLVASTVYMICATVCLLFLANRRPGADDILQALDAMSPVPLMRAVVRERLLRARVRDERNWSFVDLRLDDAADLREASGELTYAAMVARFEDVVTTTFPADADLCRVTPGHALIFASQSPAAVREMVRRVLREVAQPDDTTRFRMSASAGISPVDASVDTFDSLRETAGAAADAAQLEGGDRWIVVDAPEPTARVRP